MGFQYKRIGSSPTDANDGGVFDKFSNYQLEQQGQIYNPTPVMPVGHTATGGTVGDYYDPSGSYYRVHFFGEPGTFTISSLSPSFPAHVEYLVVGGGGGGGDGDGSGGGGAGGVKSTDPGVPAPQRGSPLPVAAASYAVVVGEGGKSRRYADVNNNWPAAWGDGTTSSLAYNGGTISCGGGGSGGSGYNNDTPPAPLHQGHPGKSPNGSGGGGSSGSGTSSGPGGWAGGGADGNGDDGGTGMHVSGIFICGGGGGGAGGAGGNAQQTSPTDSTGEAGVGGNGLNVVFFGPTNPVAIAGGGGGGARGGPNVQQGANGGPGGGGAGASESNGGDTTGGTGLNNGEPAYRGGNGGTAGHFTGSGGGGGSTDGFRAGNGAPGMVAIKYEISPGNPVGPATTEAKATGGQVVIYNDYAIHVFKSAGTFTNTSGSTITGIEYVAVGGGGAGGSGGGTIVGGGGGAGGVVSNIPGLVPATTALPGPNSLATGAPNALTITVGSGGGAMGSSLHPLDIGGLPGRNTTIASPTATLVTAYGGGGGGGNNPTNVINVYGMSITDRTQPGGSGGGGAESDHAGGEGSMQTATTTAAPGQGNDGGTGNENDNCAGGGGGAGAAGQPGANGPGINGCGGNGVQLPTGFRSPLLSPTASGSGLGAPGPGGNFWVAGGGSGMFGIWGDNNFALRAAGYGGGGRGIFSGSGDANWPTHPQYPTLGPVMENNPGEPGMMGTGGGGGAGPDVGGPAATSSGGGIGGSGLVVIRYPTS